MNSKPNWEGKFNWHGEVLTYYRHAHSKAEAKTLMLNEMSKVVDKPLGVLCNLYNGTQANFDMRRI